MPPLFWPPTQHCALPLAVQNPTARLELHEAKDGGVYVKGLNTFVVKSEAEIAAVLEVGGRCFGSEGVADACAFRVWSCAKLTHNQAEPPAACSRQHPHTTLLPQVGKRNRSVGATLMNQDSSRSHSVFTITIEAAAAASSGAADNAGSGGSIRVRCTCSGILPRLSRFLRFLPVSTVAGTVKSIWPCS